jgi:hypothetical protein
VRRVSHPLPHRGQAPYIGRRGFQECGDPEVNENNAPRFLLDAYVRRPEVPMDDPFPVRGRECVGDGCEDATCFSDLQAATPFEKVLQTAALHVLHDDIGGTSGKSPDSVNGDDVGMVNRCRRLRLAFETKAHHLIGRYVLTQELHGDEAVEWPLFREEDSGDRAFPDQTADLQLGGKFSAQTVENGVGGSGVGHGIRSFSVGDP